MFGFLPMEGKAANTLEILTNLAILNILFLISCIPIVTIGAAVTALYDCVFKIQNNTEQYIIRDYIKSFRKNFKQATQIWAIASCIIAVLAFDISVYTMVTETAFVPLFVISIILCVTCFTGLCYVFPMIGYFQNTNKNMIINAYKMAVFYLPCTIPVVIVNGLPLYILLKKQEVFLSTVMIYMLIGFGLAAFVSSVFLQFVFRRCVEKVPETEAVETEVLIQES